MQVICGQCRAAFVAAPHLYGKRVTCPQCGGAIEIGQPADPPVPVTLAPPQPPVDPLDPFAAPASPESFGATAAPQAAQGTLSRGVARGIALSFYGSLLFAVSILLSYTYAVSYDFGLFMSQHTMDSMAWDAVRGRMDLEARQQEMQQRSESLRKWGRWIRTTADLSLKLSQLVAVAGLGLFGVGYYFLYHGLPQHRRWFRPACIALGIAAALQLMLRTFPALANDRICDDSVLLATIQVRFPFFFILATVAAEAAVIVWMLQASSFLNRLPWSDGDLGIQRTLLLMFTGALAVVILMNYIGRVESLTVRLWIYRAGFWVRLVAILLMTLAVGLFAKRHHAVWKATSSC